MAPRQKLRNRKFLKLLTSQILFFVYPVAYGLLFRLEERLWTDIRFWSCKMFFIILTLLLSTANCGHEFEHGYYHDDGACFSPDGDYIAFSHAQVYYQESGAVDTLVSGIYIMKFDGTELQLVCEGVGNMVDWSPDGKMLVFNAYNELWLYIMEKDSLIQLTNDGEIKHSARFSPDNKKIAYYRPFVPGGICIMNVDGTDDHSVINDGDGGPACGPDWFNSGDRFLYVGWFHENAYPEFTTILCYADTTGENLVKFLVAEDMEFVADIFEYTRLSPDEKEILFYARKEGKEQNHEIWKVNIDGTNPRRLTYTGGEDPCWSPDGEWIIFSDGSTGGLSIMRPDGSDCRSITEYD
jgi:Tol biopolymer transport system component